MSTAVVMITRKCNMSCRHCSVESHPGISSEPSAEELRRIVMELGEAGVKGIQFTGGEPLIRHKLLFELMELANTRYGIGTAIISNGFWGKKPERAREIFQTLRKFRLVRLAISYDRFHAKFMGPEPVCNILEVAREEYFPVNINITRTADDSELDELLTPFRDYENTSFRFYDVQPVGSARNLTEELRGRLEGFCSGCEQPTICDDGRMTACNGPAYFEPDSSALILGRVKEKSVQELLAFHESDPVLQTIRLSGPMELKRILQSSPKFRDYPFKKHYSGVCQLCREICGNPEAVQELRERLSAPAETAMRLAQQQVKTAARGDLWNRDAVNSKEARRAVFLVLSKEPEKNRTGIDQILGRADMDWYRLAEMIVANGLAARVLQRREHLASYAPSLFWPFLHHGAAPWNATAEPLEELLLQWRRSDFENILTLAVLLEENPELLEQLKRDHSPLGRLALFLLLSNGLTSRPEAPIQSRTRLTRIRYGLGQTVLQARGVGRLNFLVKPLLQVLCLPGGGMGLGIRALIRDLKASFRVRGWKETLLLLAKDFWRAIVAGQKICSVRK